MAKGTVNYTPKGPSKRDIDFDVYTERDVTKSQVNWADVAKNITGEIETIRNERQGRKAEIQKATDEAMTKLDDMGKYDNQTLMDLVVDGSNFAANSMHTQKKLMEKGLIKPHDYTKFTSNVSAGFKTFKATAEGWDKDFAEYTKRTEDGTNSSLEVYLAKEVESFGNINDKQLYTNPQTGNMALASTYVDGDGITRMNEDPNTHISMQRLNALSKQRIDKVNVGEVSKVYSAELGTWITAAYEQSDKSVTSLEDIREGDDFQELLEAKANQAIANPTQAGSILADNNLMTSDGEKYRGGSQEEFDEFASANPDTDNPIIVMEYDQKTQRKIPTLTESQEKVAKDFVKSAIEGHLPHKEKVQPGKFPPPETGITRGVKDREKRYTNHYNNINDLITGNEQSATKAANSLVTRLNKEMRGVKDYVPVEKIERVDSNNDGKVDQYIIHKKGEEPFIIEGTVNDVELTSDEIAESIFDQATGGELTYEEVSAGQTMGERGEGGVSSEKVKVAKIEKGYDKQNTIIVGGEKIALTSAVDDVGDLYGDITDQVAKYDVILKEVFNMSATPGIKEAFAEEDISMTNEGDVITITIGDISYKYPNDAPGYTEGEGGADDKWDKPEDVWKFVDTVIDEAIKTKTAKSRKKDESSNEGDDILNP